MKCCIQVHVTPSYLRGMLPVGDSQLWPVLCSPHLNSVLLRITPGI